MVVYDYLRVFGGAERTLSYLLDSLDDPHLIIGGQDQPDRADQWFSGVPVTDLGIRATSPVALAAKCAFQLARANVRPRAEERVVFAGAYAPIAARRVSPESQAAYFCFSPPRFAYDLRNYYRGRLEFWKRPAFDLLVRYVRRQMSAGLAYIPDTITISRTIQARVQEYTGRRSDVVYPPVEVDRFAWRPSNGYFLSTARLEAYKNVASIVRAFQAMPEEKLIVASGGSQYEELTRMAEGSDNIMFTGWLGDEKLASLIANCRATIYLPEDEDFGISPVESLAAGKPVIGIASGGLEETLSEGKTAALIAPDDLGPDGIRAAVKGMSDEVALSMKEACERAAAPFSPDRFKLEIRRLLG